MSFPIEVVSDIVAYLDWASDFDLRPLFSRRLIVFCKSKTTFSYEFNHIYQHSGIYRCNGKVHREDGPAVVWHSGISLEENWYRNGLRHREGGPAIDNVKTPFFRTANSWYNNGVLTQGSSETAYYSDRLFVIIALSKASKRTNL